MTTQTDGRFYARTKKAYDGTYTAVVCRRRGLTETLVYRETGLRTRYLARKEALHYMKTLKET